jgi:HPr kinase/phosphorylase
MNPLKINDFFQRNKEAFQLTPVNEGAGFDRLFSGKGISRPGLALAGFWDKFDDTAIQVCGAAEVAYLRKLPLAEVQHLCRKLAAAPLPGLIIAEGQKAPEALAAAAKEAKLPVFISKLPTEVLVMKLLAFLDACFAERTLVHGSFIDVNGVGILLTGKSGIGKSEIALELMERGHRLVGDDVVTVYRKSEGTLIGTGSELLKHYIELRGIGIVDIRGIYGLRAVRQEKRLEVEVRLERWNRHKHFERLGLDTVETSYLGVPIPLVTLPIFPGKNVAIILEVVALNYLLYQTYGYRPAEKLNERLIKLMAEKAQKRATA